MRTLNDVALAGARQLPHSLPGRNAQSFACSLGTGFSAVLSNPFPLLG